MELRNDPDDVTGTDVRHITVLGRRRRRGVCPKGQHGETKEARSYREHRECTSMISADLEKPLNPSTLMLHCPHLIISHVYGFMAAGTPDPVVSGSFIAASPASPLGLCFSFSRFAAACCSIKNSTRAASCAINFSVLFRVSSGFISGSALTSIFLQHSCGCGVNFGRDAQNRIESTTAIQ